MIYKDSIYFSIATNINLRENYSITYEIIDEVATFFQTHFPIEIMFNYIDNKSVRLNKVTENNKKKLFEKLKNKEIHTFMISKRLTSKEYYGFSEEQEVASTLSFILEISRHAEDVHGISVAIPMEFLSEQKIENEVISLFKKLHCKLCGFNSFIHRGTCLPSMDFKCFDPMTSTLGNLKIKKQYVRGYFWGNVLNSEHIKKIGGMDKIKKQGMYKVEQWKDCVYIQATKNISDYTIDTAAIMKKMLLPALPPEKESTFLRYDSYDAFMDAKEKGTENFILEEDIFIEKYNGRLVYNEAKNKLHNIASDNGFICKDNLYYRLEDGFIQFFKIYTKYKTFSLKFFTAPLCSDINFDDDIRFKDVNILWGSGSPYQLTDSTIDYIKTNPFGIDFSFENYVEDASEILKRAFCDYLLPWFSDNTSIEKAYNEFMKLERFPYLNLTSGEKFLWELKLKNFEKAEEYFLIYYNGFEHYAKENDDIKTYQYLEEISIFNKKFEEKDYKFFETYIVESEKNTILKLSL